MIRNLPREGKIELLAMFNQSWREGVVPGGWKKAQIIPLLKVGKDPKERSSYRPVSLTPVTVKVLERMITNRLMYWLENNNKINNWQAGFQKAEAKVLKIRLSDWPKTSRMDLR